MPSQVVCVLLSKKERDMENMEELSITGGHESIYL
jgi:hypothetical protein